MSLKEIQKENKWGKKQPSPKINRTKFDGRRNPREKPSWKKKYKSGKYSKSRKTNVERRKKKEQKFTEGKE